MIPGKPKEKIHCVLRNSYYYKDSSFLKLCVQDLLNGTTVDQFFRK